MNQQAAAWRLQPQEMRLAQGGVLTHDPRCNVVAGYRFPKRRCGGRIGYR